MAEESGKEATILELSEGLGSMLADLRNRLDSRFYRAVEPKAEGKEVSETIPNVLDEIIENLTRDKAKLSSIINLVSEKVLPKIN